MSGGVLEDVGLEIHLQGVGKGSNQVLCTSMSCCMPLCKCLQVMSDKVAAGVPTGFEPNAMADRAVAREQPSAKERPGMQRPSQRWACTALVAKRQTGKATRWTIEPPKGPFRGPTEADAIAARTVFLQAYMNPVQRSGASKRPVPSDSSTSSSNSLEKRARRAVAPGFLKEPVRNTAPKTPRCGPGRGHRYEYTSDLPIEEQIVVPPANALNANWFKQLQLMQQWRTERIAQLEQQVSTLLMLNARKDRSIGALQARVSEHKPLMCAHIHL